MFRIRVWVTVFQKRVSPNMMLFFWLTINLSDLQNPLILILARIEFSGDAFPKANAAVCYIAATSNLVAVAQFFNYICKAIFKGLLCSNTGEIGILGQVQNYFGVVETNSHRMLHLHTLV